MLRAPASLLCSLAILSISIFSQTVTFDRRAYVAARGRIVAQADLNEDGVLDFVVSRFGEAKVAVVLLHANGTYDPPRDFPTRNPAYLPQGISDDFNKDDHADVVMVDGDTLSFIRGNGDGTLGTPAKVLNTDSVGAVAAADFNRDGNVDLAMAIPNQFGVAEVKVAFGFGNGTFNAPFIIYRARTSYTSIEPLLIGDFDADGRADIAFSNSICYGMESAARGCETEVTVLYTSDGEHFTGIGNSVPYGGSHSFTVGDLNLDGRSDLVGTFVESTSDAASSGFRILRGSSTRVLTPSSLIAQGASPYAAAPRLADYNGDGRLDIASYVFRPSDNSERLEIFLQQAGDSFSPFGQAAFVSDGTLYQIEAGDYNRDRKPDAAGVSYNSGTLFVGSNTTSGSFPTCTPPAPVGINFCSTSTSSELVRFNIAASWWAGIRRLEVWVDGSKRIQTYSSYASYAFMDQTIGLTPGNHRVTIYAVGFDNRLQRHSATINVGDSGPGCIAPSAATVSICSPENGSTVTSPVQVRAQGGSSITFMEVWVDGTKSYQTSGNRVDTAIALGGGTHVLTVIGKSGGTVTDKKSVTFTVTGGSCANPAAPGVTVCSPVHNSLVNSPVRALASATVSGTLARFELWVDGGKKFSTTSRNMDVNVPLPPGTHRFSFIAVNTAEMQWKTSVSATVQ